MRLRKLDLYNVDKFLNNLYINNLLITPQINALLKIYI